MGSCCGDGIVGMVVVVVVVNGVVSCFEATREARDIVEQDGRPLQTCAICITLVDMFAESVTRRRI